MKTLQGKTALITGASRGIGTYIARALANEGMNLILAARSADSLETLAAELRSQQVSALGIPADISKRDQLEILVARAEDEGGGVDVLVNNAGLEDAYPYDQVSPDIIDQIIEVNLTAPMILSRLFLPKMFERGWGHIVNIASLAGLFGGPYQETYTASKHGLVGFTRSLRLTAVGEDYPVGVSVICPGFISDAGMYHTWSQSTGLEAPASFGTSPPEDVAKAVVSSIIDNKQEVIVNSRPFRPLLLAQALSPALASWLALKTGGLEHFQGVANHKIKEKVLGE